MNEGEAKGSRDFGNERRIETADKAAGYATEKVELLKTETVGEQLERSITRAQGHLLDLVALRNRTPSRILDLPVSELQALAHPGYPF